MVTVGGNNTAGEKELKRKWPIEEGLTAGTTKQEGTKPHLEPQGNHGQKDLTDPKDRVGL